jgi:hypothetical protein
MLLTDFNTVMPDKYFLSIVCYMSVDVCHESQHEVSICMFVIILLTLLHEII